jgi:hypothetical protein
MIWHSIALKNGSQEALYVQGTSCVQYSVQKTMSVKRINMSLHFSVLKVEDMRTLINYWCRNNENFSGIYFSLNYCAYDLRTQKPICVIYIQQAISDFMIAFTKLTQTLATDVCTRVHKVVFPVPKTFYNRRNFSESPLLRSIRT